MKIEITRTAKTAKYPYIGIHKDDIERDDPMLVYFIAENTGVMLATNNNGYLNKPSSTAWDEPSYIPFAGQITLSN